MENCIFCKIVKGEIPAFKVYESENVIAFLDLTQLTRGHTLVIPKNHKRWLWDHDDKEYCDLMVASKKIANVMRKLYNIEWVEMIVAGMGVEHTHVHIIPRYENDGHKEVPAEETKIKKFTQEEMKQTAEELKQAIETQIKSS